MNLTEEQKKNRRAAQKKWRDANRDRLHADAKAYQSTPKGIARRKRWLDSLKEKRMIAKEKALHKMNITIPDQFLPDAFQDFTVEAEVDHIEAEIGFRDHYGPFGNLTEPVFGRKPISVDSITIEAGGETFSSDQLKELQEEITEHILNGEGADLLN